VRARVCAHIACDDEVGGEVLHSILVGFELLHRLFRIRRRERDLRVRGQSECARASVRARSGGRTSAAHASTSTTYVAACSPLIRPPRAPLASSVMPNRASVFLTE
jgi:hypothetical protein